MRSATGVKDSPAHSKELKPERQFVRHPAGSLLPPWQAVAILVGWSILAYYSHLVLVTLLFAVGLIEILSCVLLEDHADGFESVYGKVEGIRSEIQELRESVPGLEDKLEGVSGQLARLSEIVSDCGLEECAWRFRNDSKRDALDDDFPLWSNGLRGALSYVWKLGHGLSILEHRLRDAVLRIDPQAVRTLKELGYAMGELETPNLDDYTPSISRLEKEIAGLRREIETLRCKCST
jgi:hypothetical protein